MSTTIRTNLLPWVIDYTKYIDFQCAVLLHAFQYGGNKFSKYQLPTFEQFKALDLTEPFFAQDYNPHNKQPDTFHNVMGTAFRPDLHFARVEYSVFMGIKWNHQFTFRYLNPDMEKVDRELFIKQIKRDSRP